MRRFLVASLLSAVTLAASAATPKPTTTPTSHSVSTGITAPQLQSSAVIHIASDDSLTSFPNPAKMLLRVSLDESGKPTAIRVVSSFAPTVNTKIVALVQQFRWSPAMLDNQAIPADVNLVVEVQH